jgi:two-component system alkaline phosphatase synthesis response regulator PhoP
MSRIARILLVEDDESLGATLSENLILDGHQVDLAVTGESALQNFESNHFDLVILDVMLPGQSGLDTLKALRLKSACPVLMISAKGSARDRIAGLELHADDYLTKPFHLREFQLRVQALLRRPTAAKAIDEAESLEALEIGAATFDFTAREVRYRSTSEVLTEKEIKLVKLLHSRRGQVVSRNEILDLVWGVEQNPSARTVDNFVVRLRKWIEKDASAPEFLISHRGVGYALKHAKREEE